MNALNRLNPFAQPRDWSPRLAASSMSFLIVLRNLT